MNPEKQVSFGHTKAKIEDVPASSTIQKRRSMKASDKAVEKAVKQISRQSSMKGCNEAELLASMEKSKRGRKPVKDEIYIRESFKKISDWEAELDKGKNEMKKEDYNKLYCKMSALKSRVKRKQEQMW